MNNLIELKTKFEAIAGEWKGRSPNGEQRACDAQDIVDLINEMLRGEREIVALERTWDSDKEKLRLLIEGFEAMDNPSYL